MSYPYLYPGECPTLDDIREAMAEQRPMGADTRSGLVGWWPGRHRGATLLDFSGRANTGTWSGTGTRWAVDAERQGVVLTFNGTNDYIDIGDRESLDLFGTDITILAWINKTDSAFDFIVSKNIFGWCFATYNSPARSLLWYSGNQFAISAGDAYGDGSGGWYCVAAVFDAATATVKFYSNGRAWQGADSSAAIVQRVNDPVVIGVDSRDYSGFEYTGRLDDLRIYTRALSAAEIRHIYDCGRVAPLSDLVEPVGWETVGAGGVVVPWHLFGRVA